MYYTNIQPLKFSVPNVFDGRILQNKNNNSNTQCFWKSKKQEEKIDSTLKCDSLQLGQRRILKPHYNFTLFNLLEYRINYGVITIIY